MVKLALVGYGAIGCHHARNLASMSDVHFVGVVEPSFEAASAARESGFTVFDSLDNLWHHDLDGVIVAVPTQYHEEVTLQALEHCHGVLVEKPVAATAAAGERILRAAKSTGVAIMVGYVERYNAAIRAAKALIDSGALGEILTISARRVGAMPPRIRDANVLIDIGVHDIDIAAFLSGKALRLVSAQGGRAFLEDRLDYASLSLSAGSIAVEITSNWITPVKIRTLAITGRDAFLSVDYITQNVVLYPGRSFKQTGSFSTVLEQYTEGEAVTIPVEKQEPLYVELRTFIDGLRGAPLPDPGIALESLRIAEGATAFIEASAPIERLMGAMTQ
jgi:UDP-N-acetylglucosamine 3-dehydrogenase